jgi:hypothetical protein
MNKTSEKKSLELFVPDDENIKIWRYMDFTKFVEMINSQTLFFSRSDKFEDKYEGFHLGVAKIAAAFERITGDKSSKAAIEHMTLMENVRKSLPLCGNINCWHMNEYESSAMWKSYVKHDEGIAIQSTFKKLKDSLSNNEEKIEFSTVKYIDYEKAEGKWGPESAFIHKRKSFEYEKELRALILKIDSWKEFKNDPEDYKKKEMPGIKCNVNLLTLIENIYIAPTAPKWFSDLAKDILEKYELNLPIKQSELEEDPSSKTWNMF